MTDNHLQLKRFLRKAPITAALADDTLDHLIKTLTLKTYRSDAPIYRVGEHVSTLYLIIEGKVRFDLGFVEGQSNHIGIAGSGEHFGDLEILTHQPSVANAITVEACKIALIPAETFLNLFQNTPQVSQALALKFAILFHLGQQLMAIAINETVDKKLALLLLGLNQQVGTGPNKQRIINLKLAQEDIANMLGVTRQAISKPLQDWKNKGWISISNRIVTLHDLDQLKAVASFNLDFPRLSELNAHPSVK